MSSRTVSRVVPTQRHRERMEQAVAEEKQRLREAADIEILVPLSRDSKES